MYNANNNDLQINKNLFTLQDTEPSLSNNEMLTSQMCTASQFDTDLYSYWCNEIKEEKKYHRKQWEFIYILQALSERGLLQKGKKGIGFGVGQEPLPIVFAKYGVQVLATDIGISNHLQDAWEKSDQRLSSIDILNKNNIVSKKQFKELINKGLISIMDVDMNNIPSNLNGYDFTWSSCSLEHLGSIANSLKFIENSLKTLKSGGIAVHTTEYNLSSDDETIEYGGTVIFRKKDIKQLVKNLTAQGHEVHVNYNFGSKKLDQYIDVPPYLPDQHLKLQLSKYIVTSIGLIIRKK